MTNRQAASIVLLVFFIPLCLQAIESEAHQETRTQELTHEVTVTLKLIQVYVTDGSGNPVTDLRQDEFIIYDNKKLQQITDFEKYILFPVEDRTAQQETKDIETPESGSEVMNRKFFLFFDMVNNNAKGFQKAREAARHFLDSQLLPGDEVGIVSYSVLKQLTLHEYLTKDHGLILDVIDRIGGEGRVGRAENFEAMLYSQMSGEPLLDASQASTPIKGGAPAHLVDPADKSIMRSGWDAFAVRPNAAATNDRFLRNEHKNITRNMMLRFIDFSKALRYISGHKHIILFSSGIPYSLIHGVESANPAQSFGAGVDTVLRDKYEEMLKELSAANTTVFSINTEPLSNNMNLPAHMKGEVTLRRMSQDTGGKFIGNVQNYAEILETVKTHTGSYYVLGYYVSETWDGRYHPIEVKVSRSGCRVFAQKGYFSPKPFSEYSGMEKELHLMDLALTDQPLLQVPLEVPMTAVPCPVGNKPGVCLLARIQRDRIRESMGDEAEIFFLAFDENEEIKHMRRKAVKVSEIKDKEAYYYSLLPIAPGTYKFRIILRDMEDGTGAVGRYSADIPDPPAKGIQLYPPLLLLPGESGFFVRGHVPTKGTSRFPLLDYFPFDPAQFTPALGTIPADTRSLRGVLHCSLYDLENPALRFTAAMIDNSSGWSYTVPVRVISAEKKGEQGTLLVEFQMPALSPGEFRLVMEAQDTVSGLRSLCSTTFKID